MWFVALLAVVVVAFAAALNAQDETPPKFDLFIGYQWLNPGGTVPVGSAPPFQQPPPPVATKLPSMPIGFGTTGTYNFDKWWGLSVDVGGNYQDLAHESTISAGPRLMWRGEGVNFFVHTLVGLNRLSPRDVPASNGFGAILGGGMDLNVFKGLSLRLFEADYVLGRQNFAGVASPTAPGLQRPTMDGARLRSGLVFNFGGAPETPVAATCSIDKGTVLVGEPLHVTVAPSNFNPKHTLTYSWSSSGGKIEGKDTGASIDTAGAAPGDYTATATVTDARVKKNNSATCTSKFTLKPLNPPQMSCSASPTAVDAGTAVTVTCSCTSPDNVPVTVAGWSSTGGSVSGSGNSATLNTTGASPGAININATCTDSRGLTASASSSTTINTPPPPPKVDKEVERRLALHSVYFATAKPTVQEPSGGLVKSQEATLDSLASDFKQYIGWVPEAHLTLQGHADVRGSVPYNQALSERRVARVKSYLVEHGVPESSLATEAFGKQQELTEDQVKASIDEDSTITKEERARIGRNMKVIIWAQNRRVDIVLKAPGISETSVRRYPFNAADALSLIGGREAERKAKAAKKAPARKKAPAKKQ